MPSVVAEKSSHRVQESFRSDVMDSPTKQHLLRVLIKMFASSHWEGSRIDRFMESSPVNSSTRFRGLDGSNARRRR